MWSLTLQRDQGAPLRRQMYEQLRVQILQGSLQALEALPSTREMALAVGVSRSTVVEAYDMLLAEGFLHSSPGAATRVAQGLCMEPSPVLPAIPRPPRPPAPLVDFGTGRPDLQRFPYAQWHRCMAAAAQGLAPTAYGYTGPHGLAALRAEIAAWLLRSRGFSVAASDIFITAGATHALHLLAGLLCPGGGKVLMEDPCHTGMLRTLVHQGCEVVPVPVDAQGMQTQRLQAYADVRAIYVTPSHQFPLGGVMPAGRRAALVRYAREQDVYIIEDDYDSEFRYVGAPIAPLHAMDPQRVAYVGTFSKTVFPALRIGYAVLPARLQAAWRQARMHMDVQSPVLEQAALALFLQTRGLDRHIYAMRRLYGRRRQALLDALDDQFGRDWLVQGDAAGLHVAVRFPGRLWDAGLEARCAALGVAVTPVARHCICPGGYADALVLGYGHLEPEAIRRGIALLAAAMRGD